MDFYEVLERVLELLQRHGRLSYRALKVQFELDDEHLALLKDELVDIQEVARDQDNKMLIWSGKTGDIPEPTSPPEQTTRPDTQEAEPTLVEPTPDEPHTPDAAERRQLTVMFCDLVGSTSLSGQMDAEDYREIVRAYQSACGEVIERFDCHLAQTLGDGLLIYSGYPVAHENDAERAVRAGLGILDSMKTLNERLEREKGIRLAVRVGIHTGLVVVGEVGAGTRQEQLALGETPNVAARIQGLAEPDTVVISDATYRLIQGYFDCQELGEQTLRGVAQEVNVYRVLQATEAQSRLEVASTRGLTPLVGRESESTLLVERWTQAKEGQGQVVLLSGEAGIGKSRLVQALKEHVADEPHAQEECRCSPYHTNSAFYPLADLLQRKLGWQPEDTADEKLHKLETVLAQTHLDVNTAVPLFTMLLSLPLPDDRYPTIQLSSQQQRQQTLEAFLQLVLLAAEQHPVLFIVEDLHWVDPSTLEFLELLIDQTPTTDIFVLFTCRPEFQPTWSHRSYLTEISLNRLSRPQIEQIATQVASGKGLPADVIEQLVDKTDGVPLYVEEMTKSVLESGVLKDVNGHYELSSPISSLAIPATLQDSLMSRLDRLMTAKVIAQLGATIGRQFSYELLQAVSELDETMLQHELGRLVAAELIYQRGLPSQATYMFKHALVQDTAYESLLRSTRQGYHRRIAEVLEARFPETAEAQPELLAHHYTEAGLNEKAVGYWYQAGQRASERSANEESLGHLTRGLGLLEDLPETPERMQQELHLLVTLGPLLIASKGTPAPEVRQAYTRAKELCQQVGESTELFTVTFGLWFHAHNSGQLETARGLTEELTGIAEQQSDPGFLLQAHHAAWTTLHRLGNYSGALHHAEQGIALYNFDDHRTHAFRYAGHDPGVCGRLHAAMGRWLLGYPNQALDNVSDAVTLAENLSHPYSLTLALRGSAWLHQCRWEAHLVLEHANTAIDVCGQHGFAQYLGEARVLRGWAVAIESQTDDGIEETYQGLTAYQYTGAKARVPYFLTILAEMYGKSGQTDQALQALVEALNFVSMTGERTWEAEIHRLRGVLLLMQPSDNQGEAETCFHQALEVSRSQQAKSLELRAATSLTRLWQSQGKRQEARELLGDVYSWFTEGFDTADLKDAKALLEELS